LSVAREQGSGKEGLVQTTLPITIYLSQVWTVVPIGAEEPIGWMELWLACTMDGLCRIMVQLQDVERGMVKPAFGGSVAIFDPDSFAYLMRA
jgi:hypothetical protein